MHYSLLADDGRIVVTTGTNPTTAATTAPTTTPVDLPLSLVLGKMPQKHFHLTTPASTLHTAPGERAHHMCTCTLCITNAPINY